MYICKMKKSRNLFTCSSPLALSLYQPEESIVVVIDVFRATSTICAALANGAKAVLPISDVETCIKMTGQPGLVTGGERKGMVIDGLQFGNSPLDYTAETIRDRTLVLTTTNGVKLLNQVEQVGEVITGAFLNLSAVCNYLLQQDKDVYLVCAGWFDKENMEDLLFCGAVVEQIGSHFNLDDSSMIALALKRQANTYPSIFEFLKSATHFQRLLSFGVERDLVYCCQVDKCAVVPLFTQPYLVKADF